MAPQLRSLFSSPEEVSNLTDSAMVEGITSQFPIQGRKYKIDVSNLTVVKANYTHEDEKKAILSSSSLTYPIKGSVTLTDITTGKVVDQANNYVFADTYYITPKHTLLYSGNNYIASNLLVRLPGVFVRHTNTGDLEAEFNTGKGQSFSIVLYPKEQLFKIHVDGSEVPAAVVISTVFGVPTPTVNKYVPAGVWLKNLEAIKGKEPKYVNSLYNKFVSKYAQNPKDSLEVKIEKLKESLLKGELSKTTTKITMGVEREHMDPEIFLMALKNLVLVYRGDKEEDNRDSLQFKRVQGLPDFIKSRFDKNGEVVKKAAARIKGYLDRYVSNSSGTPTIRAILGTKPFNRIFTDFIVNSTLSSTPSETNPIESIEAVGRVTLIGPKEGGASTERMIPMEARNIHPSSLGVLDPSRTPESSTAGIDLRFTVAAKRDENGILYTSVKDRKGNLVHLSVQQMMEHTIGFPEGVVNKNPKPDDLVHAQVKGKMMEVKRKDIDYWIADASHLYTITTNLVPFVNSNHSGRLTMAGKAITQALSLDHREQPLVQTVDDTGEAFVTRLGNMISTKSPVDGVVTLVKPDIVEITDAAGVKHTIKLVKNLPFNMKGFIDDEAPKVVYGQRVTKGQLIADNNYTKDGKLALGRNLYVGYMPYKGFNHEDGIVISRSAAAKLGSQHAHKFDYDFKMDTIHNKGQFRRQFPSEYSAAQLDKLDDNGIVRVGSKLNYGDPIFTFLEKKVPSEIDRALGRLDKQLSVPFRKVTQFWENDEQGEVVDVHMDGTKVKVLAKSVKQITKGDKLTGLHGNKGIVSLILEDHEMPHSKETGNPYDALLNPASVTSRINLAQIAETAAGKVAMHDGTPYMIKNYSVNNNLGTIKKELTARGLSDVDMAYDPKTGKEFGNILSGPQYMLKLFKTTDSNYAARNVAKYDSYLQPAKGGEEGAKGVGYFELLGLIGSDARKNLKEMATVKAEKNEDYWGKFQRGEPLPKPKVTFATKKLFDYMKGVGINVREDDGHLIATPLSDVDTLKMSHGAILNPDIISAKNNQVEKGGLFDIGVTGGLSGNKWSHYELSEPMLNPMFEKSTRTMLGLTKNEVESISSGAVGVKVLDKGNVSLHNITTGEEIKRIRTSLTVPSFGGIVKKAETVDPEHLLVGGEALKAMLSHINPGNELEALKSEYAKTKALAKKDILAKKMKYLKGLHGMGVENPGQVFVNKYIPILPPVMRPVIDKGANNLEYGDMNKLYKELIISDQEGLAPLRDLLPHSDLVEQRKNVYNAIKAVAGVGSAVGPSSSKSELKGIVRAITGDEGPKMGMFHSRILKRNQDMSGRGTIYAAPDVGFNEAKFPRDMMWTMFRMHIIRELVRNGMPFPQAQIAYEKRSLAAVNMFNKLSKEIPIILNRPPTLMKTNVMAVYGKPIDDKTIGLNILHLPGFAADFDGDALMTYVPMTQEAIQEAKDKLLPSRHLSDARIGYGRSMFAPGHEAVLGSVHLTRADTSQKLHTFATEHDAMTALAAGHIHDNTPIKIGK